MGKTKPLNFLLPKTQALSVAKHLGVCLSEQFNAGHPFDFVRVSFRYYKNKSRHEIIKIKGLKNVNRSQCLCMLIGIVNFSFITGQMKLMYEKVREIDGNFVVPLSPGNCVTLAPPYLQYFNAWASFSSHRSDEKVYFAESKMERKVLQNWHGF